MPTNDFIGFASAGSANVMSQADYAAAAEQTDGVQPGPASSALANKIWRQGANMAAALGMIMSDIGYDALDDGDIATLSGNLKKTLWNVGTWTPVLSGGTTDGVFVYDSGNAGYYIKLGGLVYIYARVRVTDYTTYPAGRIRVSGLPYPGINHNNQYQLISLTGYTGGANDSVQKVLNGILPYRATYIDLMAQSASAAWQKGYAVWSSSSTLNLNVQLTQDNATTKSATFYIASCYETEV